MKKIFFLAALALVFSACTQSDPRFSQGLEAAQAGEFDTADSLFTSVLKDDPGNHAAWNNRAFVRLRAGHDSLALPDAGEAIRLDSSEHVYYEVRAAVYLDRDRFEEADADIRKALELAPRSAQAYFLRGTLYFHQKTYDKAIKSLKKSIELDPSQLESRIQLIAVYANAGQYEKAVYEATRMLDQGIIDPVLLLNRGYAAMNLGKYDLAEGDFEKALQLNPELAEARNNLGFLRFLGGKSREGRKLIEESIKLKHENALAYAFRALIFQSEGKKDSACADLLHARALGLNFEDYPKWKFRETFNEECINNQP